MKCLHINIRRATFILLTFLVNNVHKIHMVDENKIQSSQDKMNTSITSEDFLKDSVMICPSNIQCKDLNGDCITCKFNNSCRYGQETSATCSPKAKVICYGKREFTKIFSCKYCYQTQHWEHDCLLKAHCNSVSSPRNVYKTNCTVKSEVICLGNRRFNKMVHCNWTGGHSWSTALALSITLGGFGADRFYLGHWQEGIGKLFSFGGLGVWTIIDVILISLHYLGPADGSLYI
ncbi:unnamed protein product [Brassicogethes aeneus]|uniref:TM2 domain-containing protein n=1 Tax=Brassicogethes aeneus TaxID=1431903 RepID=A0A9P0ARG1_BRAAE|nr:unnamed protein product [Brassicogethes aeneus]